MKINVQELELALNYMKTFSNAMTVKISLDRDSRVLLTFEDKYLTITEITLFDASCNEFGSMQPQIRKTDTLTKSMLTKGSL